LYCAELAELYGGTRNLGGKKPNNLVHKVLYPQNSYTYCNTNYLINFYLYVESKYTTTSIHLPRTIIGKTCLTKSHVVIYNCSELITAPSLSETRRSFFFLKETPQSFMVTITCYPREEDLDENYLVCFSGKRRRSPSRSCRRHVRVVAVILAISKSRAAALVRAGRRRVLDTSETYL
jgi:hypothetical protein